MAQEAGIRFPVFLTRAVYDSFVSVPPGVTGQDEAGRLWDIVWMLRFAIRKAQHGQARLPFALYVRNDNKAPGSSSWLPCVALWTLTTLDPRSRSCSLTKIEPAWGRRAASARHPSTLN